jgi:hypothetical protein
MSLNRKPVIRDGVGDGAPLGTLDGALLAACDELGVELGLTAQAVNARITLIRVITLIGTLETRGRATLTRSL